jgi:core-2/I-Branching enzyme
MNIAYLILAHNQPNLLIREVERLNQGNAHFFIHIDKKSGQDLLFLKEHFAAWNNVTIVSGEKIFWMGFNMVRATIRLLQMAYSSAVQFKYYVLLSGQDHPIKTNEYINAFFEKHNCDFISYNSIEYLDDVFKNKVSYYHYFDNAYYNPRSANRIPWLVRLYYGAHRRLDKYLPARRFYKNYTPYFGSQWFALTSDTVKYVLDFLARNKKYIRFMKFTEGPDEVFFQTIILNSERKHHVYDYDDYTAWLKTKEDGSVFVHKYSSLRYMDWSEDLKVKPAVLDSSYYETLAASNDLFARKFDENISRELLDKIDGTLLK